MFYYEDAPVTNSEGNCVPSREFLRDINISEETPYISSTIFFSFSPKSSVCLCTFGAVQDLLLPVIPQHPPLTVATGHERVRHRAQLLKIETLLGNGLALCKRLAISAGTLAPLLSRASWDLPRTSFRRHGGSWQYSLRGARRSPERRRRQTAAMPGPEG